MASVRFTDIPADVLVQIGSFSEPVDTVALLSSSLEVLKATRGNACEEIRNKTNHVKTLVLNELQEEMQKAYEAVDIHHPIDVQGAFGREAFKTMPEIIANFRTTRYREMAAIFKAVISSEENFRRLSEKCPPESMHYLKRPIGIYRSVGIYLHETIAGASEEDKQRLIQEMAIRMVNAGIVAEVCVLINEKIADPEVRQQVFSEMFQILFRKAQEASASEKKEAIRSAVLCAYFLRWEEGGGTIDRFQAYLDLAMESIESGLFSLALQIYDKIPDGTDDYEDFKSLLIESFYNERGQFEQLIRFIEHLSPCLLKDELIKILVHTTIAKENMDHVYQTLYRLVPDANKDVYLQNILMENIRNNHLQIAELILFHIKGLIPKINTTYFLGKKYLERGNFEKALEFAKQIPDVDETGKTARDYLLRDICRGHLNRGNANGAMFACLQIADSKIKEPLRQQILGILAQSQPQQ